MFKRSMPLPKEKIKSYGSLDMLRDKKKAAPPVEAFDSENPLLQSTITNILEIWQIHPTFLFVFSKEGAIQQDQVSDQDFKLVLLLTRMARVLRPALI